MSTHLCYGHLLVRVSWLIPLLLDQEAVGFTAGDAVSVAGGAGHQGRAKGFKVGAEILLLPAPVQGDVTSGRQQSRERAPLGVGADDGIGLKISC